MAIRRGTGVFRSDLPRVLADDTNDLTPAMRVMLSEIFEDVGRVDQRIASVTRQIEALADREDKARRLMTIPGIGPLAATALLAAVGDGRQFRRARELIIGTGAFDATLDMAADYADAAKTSLAVFPAGEWGVQVELDRLLGFAG